LDATLVEQRPRDRKPNSQRLANNFPQLGGGKNGNIRAILPVHLYGQCADVDALDRVAKAYGQQSSEEIAIVEDAAQAIGAEWNGRGAGSLGVTAAFSFYPTRI